MILSSLHDIQQVMLRAYVHNVMFFATLPFYLAQERRPMSEQSRRARYPRIEDARWLR